MLYFQPPVQESDFATLSVMLFSIPPTRSSVSKLLRAGLDLRIHSAAR